MNDHHVRIDPTPGAAHIEIDGHDIAKAVLSVDISLEARQPPRITLGLAGPSLEALNLPDAEVRIPDATRDALLRLGWLQPGARTIPAEAEWDRARTAWENVRRDEWDNATPKVRMAITALGTLIGIHDGHGEE